MKILSRLHHHTTTATTVLPGAISYNANQKLHVFRYAVSQETDRIKNLISWLNSRTKRQWLYICSASIGAVLVILIGLTAIFLTPRTHTYSFSGDNCFFNPAAFPKTIDQINSDTYQTTLYPAVSIGNTPIVSTTTCIEITNIPEKETSDTVTLKSPLSIKKNISLAPEPLPVITAYDDISEPVSLDAVLLYSLDQEDRTFNYVLQIGENYTDCILHAKILGCPLKDQNLLQGKNYEYKLLRKLGESSSVVISNNLTTLDPVIIAASSIAQNQLVYDLPKTLSLTSSKNIKSLSGVTLKASESQTSYQITPEIKDTNLSLLFAEDLPRNTNFTLKIENIESTDGSYLSEPYILSFKTSAGPQVQSVNIGNYKVNPTSSITLTFDVELDPSQSIADFVSISTAGNTVASRISIQNNSLTINPDATLGSCSAFTVTVKDGIKSQFGVTGNSAWSMQSRTTCQQIFSIGNSVQGRSITGYRFGNGPTKILYVGGMHGDEKSSVRTLNSFIDDLERNYTSIPADKTVIVLPNTNPDGYAASTRINANSVDLNRNFPTFDWASGVYMPRNVFLEFGGGATPLSEPESSALASYTTSLSPRITLTFHATGRAVFANDARDSKAIADLYAEKSGFTSYNSADSDTFFSYPTTGEYEDWLRDKPNLPALLVELAGVSGNEFTRQKPALWAMLSL